MAQGYRPDRVGDQIRQELSEILSRGEVHDPGIGFITLTRVQVTADLQLARVFYTSLGDPNARKETAKALARAIFDSNNLGRLKLFGAVLSKMELDASGRVATVYVDRRLANDCGGTYEDTEGIVNLPLTVKEIQAVAFFKEAGPDDWRISMRSKGDVDVNAIAKQFGGGGHKNASGCNATGTFADLKLLFQRLLLQQIEAARKVEA
jgi:ribosome-binding factor A